MPVEQYLARVANNRNDHEAWEHIYLECRDLLSVILHQYIFRVQDRQDVGQEIWIKVISNIDKYDHSRCFRPWFFVVARRVCLDWIRRNSVRDDNETLWETIFDETISHHAREDFSDSVAFWNMLEDALASIEHKEQVVVFKMHYIDGLSLKEISELLDIPFSTIHNWPYRVKEKIRPMMADFMRKNRA